MVLKDCPSTKLMHKYWKEKLFDSFPILDNSDDSKFLALKEYISERPQKFYSERAYTDYLSFLNNLKKTNNKLLVEIYQGSIHDLDIATKTLNDINLSQIHDIHYQFDHLETILFIEKQIHFNYIKLVEAVYSKYIYCIAFNERVKRKKSTEKLDVFNCVEELKKTDLEYLTNCYDNTIRNGIAHGGITYKTDTTIYKGKKGDAKSIDTKSIITLFDNLLDICNGFTLAFKIFIINNRNYLNVNKLKISKSFLLDELKAQANAPKWNIADCLESELPNGHKQLNIYVDNKLFRLSEVVYFAFRTAVLAEYFARDFDRYFFFLASKYSLPGHAAYYGEILKKKRISNTDDIAEYKGALEDNLINFVPKYHFLKLFGKAISFISFLKTNIKDYLLYETNLLKKKFILRTTDSHRKRFSIIINDTCLYVIPDYQDDIVELVKTEHKKIISYAKRTSRKKMKYWWYRLLRISYIKVKVFDNDSRKRQLLGGKSSNNLVCTITLNSTKKIKNIDLYDGILEELGKYRIVWSSKWIKKHVR